MTTYTKNLDAAGNLTSVTLNATGATIPPDTGNSAYRQYLEWVAAGGVPDVNQAAAARIARQIQAIVSDLAALTSTQQSEIWSQFTSGTPPLWQTDAGPLANLLQAWIGTALDLGLPGAALVKAKARAVAIYTVDNPAWLVNPAWDATINVPGDQPA